MADFDPDQYLEKKKSQEPFNPDEYLKKTEPKSLGEKFMEPFKSMSVEDWKQKSLAYPAVQFIQGLLPFVGDEKTFQQGVMGMREKGQAIGQGVRQIASDPGLAARQAITAVRENPAGVAGELVKGAVYDPELMFLPAVPGAKQATQMAGQAIKSAATGTAEAAMAPVNLTKGFLRGVAYPEGTSKNTALAPIRPTYTPHEQVAEFMAGKRPVSSLTEVPSAPLYENKPIANWAYGMAPENAQGQKLVPYTGKFMEGLGEQIGSGYRTNPLSAAVDIGASLFSGGIAPLAAVYRALPSLGARTLQKATDFNPQFGPARAAALAAETGPVSPGASAAGTGVSAAQAQLQRLQQEAAQRSAQAAQTSGNPIQQQAAQQVAGLTPEQQLAQKFAGTPGYQAPQSLFATQAQPNVTIPVTRPAPLAPPQPTPAPLPPNRQLTYQPPTMYSGSQGIAGTDIAKVEQANFNAKYPPYSPGPVKPAELPPAPVTATASAVAPAAAPVTQAPKIAETTTVTTTKTPKTPKTPKPEIETPTTTEGKVDAIIMRKGVKPVTFKEQFDKALKDFQKDPTDARFDNRSIVDIQRKNVTFKHNEDFEFTHYIKFNPSNNFGKPTVYGIEKSTNTPIKGIIDTGIPSVPNSPAFEVYKQTKRGEFEFYQAYNSKGELIPYEALGNRGKAAKKLWK